MIAAQFNAKYTTFSDLIKKYNLIRKKGVPVKPLRLSMNMQPIEARIAYSLIHADNEINKLPLENLSILARYRLAQLYMRLRKPIEARKILEPLVNSGVCDSSILALLAQALYRLGQVKLGVFIMRCAISQNDTPAYYHGFLATLLACSSSWQEAHKAALEALRREPVSWRWRLLEWYSRQRGNLDRTPPLSIKITVEKLLKAYYEIELKNAKEIPRWTEAMYSIARSCNLPCEYSKS